MASSENLNQRRLRLNNGRGEIPALGFGTLISDREETRKATKAAVEAGFRHLDCAERYRNEEEVGAAVNELLADGTVHLGRTAPCRSDLRCASAVDELDDFLNTQRDSELFDAVIGRWVLMYQPDPVDTVRRLARMVRAGGTVAFQEMVMPMFP